MISKGDSVTKDFAAYLILRLIPHVETSDLKELDTMLEWVDKIVKQLEQKEMQELEETQITLGDLMDRINNDNDKEYFKFITTNLGIKNIEN